MKIAKFRPYIVFAALGLLIILPLLPRGFVLTLDMVFTPVIRMPSADASSFLFYTLLHTLNGIIPSDILEKGILFAILFLSGIGMYRLVNYALSNSTPTAYDDIGAYVAGALYVANPYTYGRFMAGQFAVLFGYALLPFLMIGILKLLERPTVRAGAFLGLWLTVIGIVSIHTLGLAAILIVCSVLLAVWRRGDGTYLITITKSIACSTLIFLVASSYWLIPLLAGRSTAAKAIAGFSASDTHAFTTLGGNFIGRLANTARLQGFWAEATHEFVMPQARMPGWGIVVMILWVAIVIGAATLWHRSRRMLVALLSICAFAGMLMASGIFNKVLEPVLLLHGFREPNKFVGLVALSYACLAGIGFAAICSRLERHGRVVALNLCLAFSLLLPIILTPTMYWGFGGQLHPVQYPAAWAAMNQTLNSDRTSFRVLVLPWHLYMYFRFADRIIMNPAPSYLDKPVISSNNPEFAGSSPDKPDTTKALLTSQILPSAPHKTTFGAQLAPLHVKYILLAKDNDYLSYAYLDRQQDLQLLADNVSFRLYRNVAFKG